MFVAGYMIWEILDYYRGMNLHLNAADRRMFAGGSFAGMKWRLTRLLRLLDVLGAKTAKACILVFLALMALSPILRTLTASTSSDSIWALSACLFIANAALADYSSARLGGQVNERSDLRESHGAYVSDQGLCAYRLTSVLSMNAAISSAVVLASRLQDDLSVFALTLFSIQLFALFPMLRHRLQVRGRRHAEMLNNIPHERV